MYHFFTFLITSLLVSLVLGDSLDVNRPEIIGEETIPAWHQELTENPIDLNRASAEDLKVFPFLTRGQIDTLLKSRPFLTKTAVRNVLGKSEYGLLSPFFIIRRVSSNLQWKIINRLTYPIQKNYGLSSGLYAGSPFEFYTQFRFSWQTSFSAGLLVQKDIGEREMYDHLSGFVEWQIFQDRWRMLIGNFIVHAGQGLILSSPFAVQRSTDVKSSLKNSFSLVRSWLSSSEVNGFSGMATEIRIPGFLSVSAFYSRSLRDASITDNYQINGLATTGLHRTGKEIAGKDALQEICTGALIESGVSEQIKLGLALLYVNYDPPLISTAGPLNALPSRRNYYRYTGKPVLAGSSFGTLLFADMELFWELAFNPSHKPAFHTGFYIPVSSVQIGLRWWHLPGDFISPFGRGFSDQAAFPNARQGIFITLATEIDQKTRFSMYWESARDLWRTFFIPIPATEQNLSVQLKFQPASRLALTGRITHQKKPVFEETPYHLSQKDILRARLELEKYFSPQLRIRSRVELSKVIRPHGAEPGSGFLVYQEIRWTPVRNIRLTARYTNFDAHEFDSRFFEAEPDPGGRTSLASFNGSGYRWFIVLDFDPLVWLRLSLKFRRIHFDGIGQIGTGTDRIDSDIREEFRFYLRFSG